MLKDRIRPLTTPQEVDAFLRENPGCAIFKAGACHKSNEMFRNVEARLGGREDLPVGLIRVIEARAASNRVADLTGISHESPSSSSSRMARPSSTATTGTSRKMPSRRPSRAISRGCEGARTKRGARRSAPLHADALFRVYSRLTSGNTFSSCW